MPDLDFERPLRELERKIIELRTVSESGGAQLTTEITVLEERAEKLQRELFGSLTAWQKVQLCRHAERPYTLDYVPRLFEDFTELHGDRTFSDDRAIVSGFARFDGKPVLVVGHQKGRGTRENMLRNFGMPNPEGYRKARRLMELAARFNRPVLTFIDTSGAYPGLGAEERGQSEAIGQCLLAMSELGVPVVATVIGEGGSGGALALGVGNIVQMMQFATYSVITPEGCASILWKDGSRGPDAATELKITAADLLRFKIIDHVIEEPAGGAHRDFDGAANAVRGALRSALASLEGKSPDELRAQRYARFRAIGAFTEGAR